MTSTSIETRHVGLYAVVGIVFVACAGITFYFCRTMSGGMEMPGGWIMSMTWMRMHGQSWAGAAGMFMAMWMAMMIAMMLPSALPMLVRQHEPWPVTVLVAAGYFLVWGVAGVVVYLPGVGLAMAAMHWDAVSRAAPQLMGAALVIAGIMQFMPWKRRALSRCRGPFSCVRMGANCPGKSAWKQGVQCGVCCVTCCFGPTLILVAVGMMNPVVIVLVAAAIAMEKLLPEPKYFVRLGGLCAVLAGIVVIGRSISL